MPENATKPTPPAAKPTPPPDAGHVPITEEFDSPKWTRPPVIPIVIGLAIVLVVIGVLVFGAKAKPGGAGGITGVYAVDMKNQPGVLVVVQVHMTNIGERPMWIKSASVTLDTDQGKWTDQAAAPVDFKRYFEAYPELKQYEKPPIAAETKIAPGAQLDGMILVGYPPPPEPNATTPATPFTKADFDKRKGLTVDVDLYDRRPLQLTEKR